MVILSHVAHYVMLVVEKVLLISIHSYDSVISKLYILSNVFLSTFCRDVTLVLILLVQVLL